MFHLYFYLYDVMIHEACFCSLEQSHLHLEPSFSFSRCGNTEEIMKIKISGFLQLNIYSIKSLWTCQGPQ